MIIIIIMTIIVVVIVIIIIIIISELTGLASCRAVELSRRTHTQRSSVELQLAGRLSFSRCKSSVQFLEIEIGKLNSTSTQQQQQRRREMRTRTAGCDCDCDYDYNNDTSTTRRRGPFNNTFNTFKSSAQCQ